MKFNKDKYFRNITGYKIPNGHFELGSNLHIKDYYYAKRLFYNSFYTNRFAFLIVKYILSQFDALIQKTLGSDRSNAKESIITLLGYENYSELLVSNVRKMLNDYLAEKYKLKREIFNHDIYTKEGIFLKNPDKIGRNILSLFPISTTFSTSIKIQGEMKEILQHERFGNLNLVFHDPVINCIIISNEGLDGYREFSQGDIEKQFGWEIYDHDRRYIEMQHFDNQLGESDDTWFQGFERPSKKILQRFFISVRTEWQKIDECLQCYPQVPTVEECLVETKASAVTPNLIFGYPKTFDYAEVNNAYKLFSIKKVSGRQEPIVYRRHFTKDNKNYIYYIRVGKFLQENNKQIRAWLSDLRKNDMKPLLDQNIVIVTPTIGSNSGFVNLVNDQLFSDTATIIQYNPNEEFLQNFKIFYADILNSADAVIFVDDVVSTTNSLSDINFFIKNARSDNKGIDCCINLINRVGYYNYTKLQEKLKSGSTPKLTVKKFFSFVNVNVTPVVYRNKFPYIVLGEKFKELAQKSVLDSMRIHFKEKERLFEPLDIGRQFDKLEDDDHPKALFQFLFLHEFNKIFTVKSRGDAYVHAELIERAFGLNRQESYEAIIEQILTKDQNNSLTSFLSDYPVFRHELRNALFKICTLDPYIHHHFIKQSVFKWVLNSLIEIVDKILADGKVEDVFFQARKGNESTAYSAFQNFKFLLKRGAKLKMNYIYSIDMLNAIRFVLIGIERVKENRHFHISENSISLLEEPQYRVLVDPIRTKAIFPVEFITYYVGLLEELIIEHEAKALQLVVNIKKIIDRNLIATGSGKTLKNSYNDHFTQLLRLLVIENTFIFHTSSDKFLNKAERLILFSDSNTDEFIGKLNAFERTYSFQFANNMLSRFDFVDGRTVYKPEASIFMSFQYMILLKALLRNDLQENKNSVSIKDKLTKILELICQILEVKNGGTFLAIKHKNRRQLTQTDDVVLVGEYRNEESFEFMGDDLSQESLLFKVFDGVSEKKNRYILSTFELSLDSKSNYHFRENEQVHQYNLSALYEFQVKNTYKNIFYLRIADIAIDQHNGGFETASQAVICVYNNMLNEDERQALIKVLTNAPNLADQRAIPFGRKEPDVIIPPSYERFDPKKIRQLLLLRNDLNDFINHHLNNDSLRAYIEILNKNKYYYTLKHGTVVYETLVKNYLKKLQTADTISGVKENANFLKVAITYLMNKVNLMTIAAKLFDMKDDQYPVLVRHKLKEFADEIEQSYKYILTMEQDNLNFLEDVGLVVFDRSGIPEEFAERKFSFCKNLMKELVFEILYNIKKHAVNPNPFEINDDNKLIITVALVEIKKNYYVQVTNNFSDKSETFIKGLSDNLLKRRNTDGLNLIYNIINIISKRMIFLEEQADIFKIYIPLSFD
ncbi:hypothetical protein SNE26_09230 [Mucilaginibacter sp. cycad4]|uniref:hypothetical protein n=1 Tax=Mucilaginibacter sp. cycad4 TaxID=3342096 RepID=UPI002AABB473|nr:hypothetical protein [Mucilaginibacter gossypii]WPV01955.1 hypothetical protein SNE26_09230 [Mucilaginibacter gossypii]